MIAITLPIRLISESNSRSHWAKRAKRVHEQRCLARMAVNVPAVLSFHVTSPHVCGWYVGMTEQQAQELTVTLTRIAPRPLDSDNTVSSCKAVRDGIADALGIDDRDKRVTWCYAQRRGKVKEYGVEIRIEART